MLEGEVELDDFYHDSHDGGRGRGPGRSTDRQPMIAAVERRGRGEGRGRCAIRVVPDCSGATYARFAGGHVDRGAHVRADDWSGTAAGLRGWAGLDQRPFDASDVDARLPTVHHVISNFEAWVQGTFHGLALGYLQAYADEFSWRYSHRGGDATTALLADCCKGYYARRELHSTVFLPQQAPDRPPEGRAGRSKKAA